MTEQELWSLIALIGLLVQIGISALLWLFFLLLKQHAGRRSRFFRFWTLGWVVLLLALVFLSADFYGLPAGSSDTAFRQASLLLYQTSKLAFLLLLVAGILEYADGRLPQNFMRHGLTATLLVAVLCLPIAGDLARLALVQSTLTVIALAYGAVRLLRLPAVRRTLGAKVTAWAFLIYAFYRCVYGLNLYKVNQQPLSGPLGLILDRLERFNGYVDALLQLLIAFGMVLMLLEDARRETNAAHAELAVAHEKLLHDSLTDPLTGVYNRLAFTRGVFLQSAGSTHGAVFIFDLDNLKRVNDSHGHEAGDELLRYFVMTLRGGLRPADQVYRWGGDEFLLLLPGATYGGVGSRLMELLHETPPLLFSAKEIPLQLEVSIGGAPYTDLASLRSAVNIADRAMYEQKRIHKTAPPPAADMGDVVT